MRLGYGCSFAAGQGHDEAGICRFGIYTPGIPWTADKSDDWGDANNWTAVEQVGTDSHNPSSYEFVHEVPVSGDGQLALLGASDVAFTATVTDSRTVDGVWLGGTGSLLPTVEVDGGTLTVGVIVGSGVYDFSQPWVGAGITYDGGGTIALAQGGTFAVEGPSGAGVDDPSSVTIAFTDGSGDVLSIGTLENFDGTITGLSGSDEILLTTLPYDASDKVDFSAAGHSFTITQSGTVIASLTLAAAAAKAVNIGGNFAIVACLAAGARILTAAGEVPVEQLRGGDLLPAVNSCRASSVRWLGQRCVAGATTVRIAADALGVGAPRRTLCLSPDHAVFVAGALIPARYLVNGASIAAVEAASVSYWHVELDRHDVIVADGLACESYLDTGNRAALQSSSNRGCPTNICLTAAALAHLAKSG